eukprot:1188657-Prorocentrum_minimum.AAC.1
MLYRLRSALPRPPFCQHYCAPLKSTATPPPLSSTLPRAVKKHCHATPSFVITTAHLQKALPRPPCPHHAAQPVNLSAQPPSLLHLPPPLHLQSQLGHRLRPRRDQLRNIFYCDSAECRGKTFAPPQWNALLNQGGLVVQVRAPFGSRRDVA